MDDGDYASIEGEKLHRGLSAGLALLWLVVAMQIFGAPSSRPALTFLLPMVLIWIPERLAEAAPGNATSEGLVGSIRNPYHIRWMGWALLVAVIAFATWPRWQAWQEHRHHVYPEASVETGK